MKLVEKMFKTDFIKEPLLKRKKNKVLGERKGEREEEVFYSAQLEGHKGLFLFAIPFFCYFFIYYLIYYPKYGDG